MTAAMADVSIAILPGQVHAIVGENGAGKSTLIKILTGVHQPDEGEMLVDGKQMQIRSTSAPLRTPRSMV